MLLLPNAVLPLCAARCQVVCGSALRLGHAASLWYVCCHGYCAGQCQQVDIKNTSAWLLCFPGWAWVHRIKFSVPLCFSKARAPIPFGEKYMKITHDRNSSKTTSFLQNQRDISVKRHMKKTRFLVLQTNNMLGTVLLTLKNQFHYFLPTFICFPHIGA